MKEPLSIACIDTWIRSELEIDANACRPGLMLDCCSGHSSISYIENNSIILCRFQNISLQSVPTGPRVAVGEMDARGLQLCP